MTDVPHLCLAPLRGLTDAVFRNVYASHFSGFDQAVAPFINPQKKSRFKEKHLQDILPENNSGLPLIPQLLHTSADDFIALARQIEALGYREINWNLGCPAPMVVRKKRGSGLLPYPEKIAALLDTIFPQLNIQLSIKTRLGFTTSDELAFLLPILDDYPLKEIIIHARLGKQMYRGETDTESFGRCLALTRHKIVYNGDIKRLSDYQSLSSKFPEISRWMIGRGAITNPLLAEEIKNPTVASGNYEARIKDFHDDLLAHYSNRLSGPSHILGRMKQIWQHLILSFPDKTKQLKKLNKVKSLEKYRDIVEGIFTTR